MVRSVRALFPWRVSTKKYGISRLKKWLESSNTMTFGLWWLPSVLLIVLYPENGIKKLAKLLSI